MSVRFSSYVTDVRCNTAVSRKPDTFKKPHNPRSRTKKGSSMDIPGPVKLWGALAIIACTLGIVTVLSIRAGPSASVAITAIRVAGEELFRARVAFRDSAVDEAESHLSEAWSTLKDQRYEQSVFSAHAALQKVRDIKGGPPSLYSRRWERKNGVPENAPES
jgi:hypothetical protein